MRNMRNMRTVLVAMICAAVGLLAYGRQGLSPDERSADAEGATEVKSFRAEPTKFGELDEILAAVAECDSLVVAGPVNKADFTAIYNFSKRTDLRVLNLEYAKIENDIIPENALFTSIGDRPTPIRKIMLPEGITEIGDGAFTCATAIKEINIPSTVRKIGVACFQQCRSLESIVIPEGVEEIGGTTFNYCFSLRSVKLPSTIKKIGVCAFYSIPSSLAELTLPEGLETIQMSAFTGCILKRIEIPSSCTEVESFAFSGCHELQEAILPSHLEIIPEYMFNNCFALENVRLPEFCRVIGKNAFGISPIKILHLPATLQEIGRGAFAGGYLEAVYCEANIPPRFEDSDLKPFGPAGDNAPLYVPRGSGELYRNANGWKTFRDIIETDDFPYSGIEEATPDKAHLDGTIYDLTGNKVTDPQKGQIYVRGGRKFVGNGK